MSKKSKTSVGRKADSKKVNKFKTTPLIVVIAIVEVIVLIATVTFAWFKLAENNSVDSGLISVAPDSGLKIDFHDANKSSYINIHNYLHNFTFEPATSLDGRNIYFPTTGTFEKDDTKDIVFREGTVNDCNSKYIAVDFTLTNSDPVNSKQVFLDNSSTFNIAGSGAANPSGKALRIAFYQNDNKSGKVNSTALTDLSNDAETNVYTIFFYDSLGWFSGDEVPYVHIWRESDTDPNLSSDDDFDSFPGKPMKRIAGELYYFSFNNRKGSTDDYYDSVLFCDGKSSPTYRTVDLTMSENHLYTPNGEKNGSKYYAPDKQYSSLVSDEGYAVIAPGISAGFQRPYAPVTEINNTSGKATTVVPAYAYSIDEYFNLDAGGLFTIAPGETQSLTMIIWLEGTDPACTASTYSGAEVDLNLVFSVKGGANTSEREETYFYRFYDFTKETWIKNSIDDNGLTFKPVIQLYDVTKGRGYLMHLVSGTDNTQWQVEAPAGIIGDRLEFRRVNPSNENEIWNVWDASEITVSQIINIEGFTQTTTITVDGESQTKTVIPFTAFADGAPSSSSSSAYYLSAGASASAPAHSCGGLWGYHPVTHFTFVDGTNNIYLSSNDGVVTIEYTYYFSSTLSQTIEYKASGPDYGGQFFRFVVPKSLVDASVGISRSEGEDYDPAADGSGTPTYRFKRYYDVDGSYAINIPSRNPDITYDKTFTINSVMTGTCAMTTGNGSYDSNYFGTQLAYVQIGCTDYDNGQRSNLFKSKATFLAKFWSDYSGNDQIQNVRLRTPNGQWAGSDYKGFAVVVPSGTAQWSVWRYDENYYTIWNYPYKNGNRDMRTNFVSNNNLFKLHNFKDKNTNNDIYYDVSTTSWQKYGNY